MKTRHVLRYVLGSSLTDQAAVEEPETRTNSIGLEMVLIPAGSFMMGSDYGEMLEPYQVEETPVHKVTISRPFYLGKHEVTQAQWEAVMGSNPSKYKGRSNPVENVSWNDVQAFIKKLNEKEGTTGYRLPTEAEWEYAARAGGFILPFGLKLAQLEIQGRSLDDDFLFGQSRHQLPIGETRLLHFRQFGGHEQDGLS